MEAGTVEVGAVGLDESAAVPVAHIAQRMMAVCPAGWQRAQVRWRRVGRRREHDAATVDADGRRIILQVPDEVSELFDELRRQQYSPETGPWFRARVRLVRPDRFALDTDADEPLFVGAPPDLRDYADDAAALPWTAPPPWLVDLLAAASCADQLPSLLQTIGADEAAITFGGPVQAGRWSITRQDHQWWARAGERLSPAFPTADDAAAFALGHLVRTQGHSPPAFRAEHPIDASPDDPPLTLFRDLRRLVVHPGTLLDRLGSTEGNVTYLAGTPLPMRSLPAKLTQQPGTVYRVRRPVEVLLGEAVAWFGQPGGGTACVLPRSVRDLVAAGALVPAEKP